VKSRIIFITGTDTGVGKTLLTSLLLVHLRDCGCTALAIKPFCSGTRSDIQLLSSAQGRELTKRDINPFYFPEPVAPLVAARKHRRVIEPTQVVSHIKAIARRCECLLIEGAGGLLVPLADSFTTLDLIARFACQVVVVSRNKLGTINHTLLTIRALQRAAMPRSSPQPPAPPRDLKVVLMDHGSPDPSCASNARILSEFLRPTPLISLPFFGANAASIQAIRANQKKIKKILARILR
jgi:dethiobiotin synthetase